MFSQPQMNAEGIHFTSPQIGSQAAHQVCEEPAECETGVDLANGQLNT